MSTPSLSFNIEFSRLVWLLGIKADQIDEQKAALRGAAAQARSGRQVVSLTELNHALAVSANVADGAAELRALDFLSARMAGHSVSQLDFAMGSSAPEIMGVARCLATAPVTGDEGAAFDSRIVMLALTGVTVRLGRAGFQRGVTPPIAMPAFRSARPAFTPAHTEAHTEGQAVAASAAGAQVDAPTVAPGTQTPGRPPATSPDVSATGRDDQRTMIEAAFTRVDADRGVEELFERLVQANDVHGTARALDQIAQVTEQRVRNGLWADAADQLGRVLGRMDEVPDPARKRLFSLHLRRICTPSVLRGISLLLGRRRTLREPVTRLLAWSGDAGAEILVDLLIASAVAGERRAYCTAITQCPAARTLLPHLLEDHRWYVVRNAAELLGEMGVTEGDEALVAVLRHSDSRVRRAAVVALGRLATERALQALPLALADQAAPVRLATAHALATLRRPRSVRPLVQALEREEDADVQHALLAALGTHRTDEAVDRLVHESRPGSLLSRRPVARRLAAVHALGEAATAASIAALRTLLSDKHDEVRAAAERALADHAAERLARH